MGSCYFVHLLLRTMKNQFEIRDLIFTQCTSLLLYWVLDNALSLAIRYWFLWFVLINVNFWWMVLFVLFIWSSEWSLIGSSLYASYVQFEIQDLIFVLDYGMLLLFLKFANLGLLYSSFYLQFCWTWFLGFLIMYRILNHWCKYCLVELKRFWINGLFWYNLSEAVGCW